MTLSFSTEDSYNVGNYINESNNSRVDVYKPNVSVSSLIPIG